MHTDTPRTDAAEERALIFCEKYGIVCNGIPSDFSRQLEHELNNEKTIGNAIRNANVDLVRQIAELRAALQRLADCDWVISLPDRMDAVRKIARDALQA